MFSAVPMANGPYAVRVRLVPASSNGTAALDAGDGWDAEFSGRLARGPLHWDMQLQYFANEASTPIEDASVNWPTPYTTVARLMLPKQDTRSARRILRTRKWKPASSIHGMHWRRTGRWATCSERARWFISRARKVAAPPEMPQRARRIADASMLPIVGILYVMVTKRVPTTM